MSETAGPFIRGELLGLGFMATAAGIAEAATFPMDTIKTRLQLQDRTVTPKALGALQMAASIFKKEGVAGLYAGLSPALARTLVFTGVNGAIFSQLKPIRVQDAHSASTDSPSGAAKVVPLLAASIPACVLAQLAAAPAELVKVKMQCAGSAPPSPLLLRMFGTSQKLGLLDTARHALLTGGVAGLWRGGGPAVLRTALQNVGAAVAVEMAYRNLPSQQSGSQQPLRDVAALAVAGLAACLVSAPSDVIKTRLMAGHVLYRGAWDCAVRSVREEGWGVLFKGFTPACVQFAVWQPLFLLSFHFITSGSRLPLS